MFRMFSTLIAIAAFATALAAQDKKLTTADFAGTWNIEVMSHQIALVIEPQEGSKVTATMMMMGRDLHLKGELVDRSITLTGVPPEGGAANEGGHVPPPNAKPIVVTLQEDGMLAGEMMTNNGPVKWVGEKLKTRKKPSAF